MIASALLLCGYASKSLLFPRLPALIKLEQDKPSINASEGHQDFTMQDLLNLAESSLHHLSQQLVDYTARFEKIESDTNHQQMDKTVIRLKTQTRFRSPTLDAPRRIYMNFSEPSSIRGREVIWRQDLYDGKMAVHEPGFLLSLKTIWLDPNGFLAMQGQKHPISEIGIVKLTEQLLEKGKQDLGNPNLTIHLQIDHIYDDRATHLITITKNPTVHIEGDYQKAEVVFDPERNVVLAFRSYAAPELPSDPPQLIESYSYHDLQMNVGLTESDFDVTNAEYGFP